MAGTAGPAGSAGTEAGAETAVTEGMREPVAPVEAVGAAAMAVREAWVEMEAVGGTVGTAATRGLAAPEAKPGRPDREARRAGEASRVSRASRASRVSLSPRPPLLCGRVSSQGAGWDPEETISGPTSCRARPRARGPEVFSAAFPTGAGGVPFGLGRGALRTSRILWSRAALGRARPLMIWFRWEVLTPTFMARADWLSPRCLHSCLRSAARRWSDTGSRDAMCKTTGDSPSGRCRVDVRCMP